MKYLSRCLTRKWEKCKIKIETFLESARFSWKFSIGKFKKAEFDGKMIYEKNFLHFPSSKRKKKSRNLIFKANFPLHWKMCKFFEIGASHMQQWEKWNILYVIMIDLHINIKRNILYGILQLNTLTHTFLPSFCPLSIQNPPAIKIRFNKRH